MVKLIAIVGTNSKHSTNRQLLQYMQKHFADKAEIELVEIKDIPVCGHSCGQRRFCAVFGNRR